MPLQKKMTTGKQPLLMRSVPQQAAAVGQRAPIDFAATAVVRTTGYDAAEKAE